MKIKIGGWEYEANAVCPKCGQTNIEKKASTWATWNACRKCGSSLGDQAETDAARNFTATAATGTRSPRMVTRVSDDPFGHGE